MSGTASFSELYPLNVTAILNAASGILPVILSGGPPPMMRVDQMIASQNDVVDHVMHVILYDGVNISELFNVTVPAGSGFGTIPATDVLAAAPTSIQTGFVIGSPLAIAVYLEVVLGGASNLYVTFFGGTL